MKFKVKGTKAILEPSDKDVEKEYLSKPDIYIPIKKKAGDKDAGGDE